MSGNKSIKALEQFTETMKAVGAEKTIAALQNARSINKDKDPHIAFIIQLVCNHFNQSFDHILEEKGSQDDITYCRAFIIHYLDKEFEVPWPDLRFLFKRNQSNLYRTGRLITELDNRLEHHKQYCIAKSTFDEKIKKYKKAIK